MTHQILSLQPDPRRADQEHSVYFCTQPYGDRIIFLRTYFVDENALAYAPGAFKVENFFASVQQGIDSASAAGDAIFQGNEWSPYSTYPWPASNWTHGESAIYLESVPCNGTLPLFGGTPLRRMQQARYSDIAASLTALKTVFKNSGRTDTTGNALVIFQMFNKDEPPRQKTIDDGAVFGWTTLQNTRGEYRRYSYQGPASQKCEGEASSQELPEGVTVA